MTDRELQEEILRLKKERDAVLLVHNYQRPEIQEIADHLGDSLALSMEAARARESVIVFCGVTFMAESAKILAPNKLVLIPELAATCQLADSADVESVRELKARHPDALVIGYINTYAPVKAEVDICCTSANALEIIRRHPERPIIYLPDHNLARYAEKLLGRELIKWPGTCYVHDDLIAVRQIRELKEQHPGARVVAHPECAMDVLELADDVLGTGGMVRLARESSYEEFIIATEIGLVARLRRENPTKRFHQVETAVCATMKITTLESVYNALLHLQNEVVVDPEIADRARDALQRMLEYRG
jgi:quinolinate synthase